MKDDPSSNDLKAIDLLALGIDSGQVDPRIYDFESRQAMKDEFEWVKDEDVVWQYLMPLK